MGELTSIQWMHSCYDKTPDKAVLTVAEKHVTIEEETKKVLRVENKLKQYINPIRRVWITKPEYRTHKYKKESELVNKCDVYTTEDRLLLDFLKPHVGKGRYERVYLRDICDCPYIYGVDITMEALVRYKYETNAVHDTVPIKIGSLDIESSVIHPDQRTNLITVICDKTIYTAALDEFVWIYEGRKKRKGTIKDLHELAEEVLGEHLKKYDFTIEAKIYKDELEMYKWIFSKIHESEVDYMFIWSIGYDVPQLIKRITALGGDPKDYFCDPNLSDALKYLRFYDDRRKMQHIVEKWSWLHCTSTAQWLDAMALYGQTRRQKPKEPSYKLDAIMTNLLGIGKVDFGNKGHKEMQETEFMKYWVYNIMDAMLVQMGSWKTQDYYSLYMLTEHSTLMDFNKQTVMLSNDYHHELLMDGRVFATTGRNMTGPYDHMLTKIGGAVLDAKNVTDIGVKCVLERPDSQTAVMMYCADDDFASIYPTWKIAAAIGKENKVTTLVGIQDKSATDIEALCSMITNPIENAVQIGSQYFGLKDYGEMQKHIEKKLAER